MLVIIVLCIMSNLISMNTYAVIASGITSSGNLHTRELDYNKIASSNTIFCKILGLYENDRSFSNNNKINKVYDILKNCSKIEILEYLKLLTPLAEHSALTKLKMTIKSLENEIYNMTDETKNNYDLINENQKLKNKCEKLQNELDAITKIINKT